MQSLRKCWVNRLLNWRFQPESDHALLGAGPRPCLPEETRQGGNIRERFGKQPGPRLDSLLAVGTSADQVDGPPLCSGALDRSLWIRSENLQ